MVITLDRKDVCSLMIGCALIHYVIDDHPEWIRLHNELKRQLEKYDHQKLEEGDHSVR